MDITFYKTADLPEKINKTLVQVAKYEAVRSVTPTGEHDIVLRVTTPTSETRWDNTNYFQFDGVYYFLVERNRVANNITEIMGTIDLYMTYNSAVMGARGLLNRSSSDSNPWAKDAMRVPSVRGARSTIDWPKEISGDLNDGVYVMVTAKKPGAGVSESSS